MIEQKFPPDVCEILLRDYNTGQKIFDGDINSVIPRAQKPDDVKLSRTRSLAEVFTPAHVVKEMVDALFDDENLFWQAKIDSRCLEAACGEAPFITTRYDAESGEEIPVKNRVGVLDRKFFAIPADHDKIFWAKRAVQSVYGYELQGDSLLIARANVLLTFAEFVEEISDDNLREVAEIVSQNFWQMDGMKIPDAQGTLFDNANDCKLVDWRTGHEFFFTGGNVMKFDFLISNPPYQDDTPSGDNKTFSPPLYDKFMEASHHAAEKVVLITPARFLFDAGATPKAFNRRMLNDPHLKVLHYEPDASKLFRNVEIKGGVAVTLHDTTKNFGAIGVFTAFEELNSIHHKVCVANKNFQPLNEIMRGQMTYRLSTRAYEDFPDLPERLPNRTDTALRTNAFEVMPDIFLDAEPDDGREYLKIFGRVGTERVYRYVRREYMIDIPEFETYKVFLPKASGTGELGETLSNPVIGEPKVGATQTFITVGAFDTRDEAENCLKYIKSKFARSLLGVLKSTQDNPPPKWAKVPLQDFSASSDIDWHGDIDDQLYRKYGLSDTEISFIETHVKAMP